MASIVAPTLPKLPKMNTGYSMNSSNDDRDSGNGFEFTRRKKWPQLLLQELVGSALFCLKPVPTNQGSSHSSASCLGWKMVYVSPAVSEMVSQKADELEGKDFFDLVFAPDQPQLQNLLTSLVMPTPPLPHQPSSNSVSTSSTSLTPPATHKGPIAGESHTIFVRMMAETPVVWELRAHSTSHESGPAAGASGQGNVGFGYGGSGALVPQQQQEAGDGMKGRAIWVMGRKAVETAGDDNGQSLDAFLELKLENERLREELKELQQDLEDEDIPIPRPLDPMPVYQPASSPSPSSPSPSDGSSSTSSPALKNKPVKKRQKKVSVPGPGGIPGKGDGEGGLHVCVTCGRTDSPEWRKGPLGPKTLCNACGLRWAKRNSTAPSRKEKKLLAEQQKKA